MLCRVTHVNHARIHVPYASPQLVVSSVEMVSTWTTRACVSSVEWVISVWFVIMLQGDVLSVRWVTTVKELVVLRCHRCVETVTTTPLRFVMMATSRMEMGVVLHAVWNWIGIVYCWTPRVPMYVLRRLHHSWPPPSATCNTIDCIWCSVDPCRVE